MATFGNWHIRQRIRPHPTSARDRRHEGRRFHGPLPLHPGMKRPSQRKPSSKCAEPGDLQNLNGPRPTDFLHTKSAPGVALPGYSCSRCVIGPGLGLGAQSRLIETSGRRCALGRDGSEPGRSVERPWWAGSRTACRPCGLALDRGAGLPGSRHGVARKRRERQLGPRGGPPPPHHNGSRYVAIATATRNPAIVLAGAATSVLFGLQRCTSGGLLAPALSHPPGHFLRCAICRPCSGQAKTRPWAELVVLLSSGRRGGGDGGRRPAAG